MTSTNHKHLCVTCKYRPCLRSTNLQRLCALLPTSSIERQLRTCKMRGEIVLNITKCENYEPEGGGNTNDKTVSS